MSMRTKINGFTAWVNLRLTPYNQLLNNVLMDLLNGTHMKYFVESFTGRNLKRLENMDGLTEQQKQTRVDWVVEELKKCRVIPDDVHIDTRLFAMRSADHVFDLLWRLISHDIWFLWERAEYLQVEDNDVLTQVPFRWTPEPPPRKKKKKEKPKQSLLSGFGSSGMDNKSQDDDDDEKWIRFPNAEYMKGFKKKKGDPEDYPPPEEQPEMAKACSAIIDDFVDSRVLCALVNSFVPNTFTADLLLNDRWTIHLALKTAEKMFYAETPFDAEDLVEAEPIAVCAYFAFFLMVAYRYRQTTAVVERVDFINMLIREVNLELEKFPAVIAHMGELQQRKDLKKWVQHVEHVQNEMRHRFEVVEVPRNITINDFCVAAVINLSLTNGSGFYYSSTKENVSEGKRIEALNLPSVPSYQMLEINPEDYPEFEFFFEAPSRNKQLRTGSFFLYQVFPGNTSTWQRLFIKSARDNEYETVEKMIAFFRDDTSFVNSREPKTGNTALHWACRMGHFLLIEWGCDVHSRNVKGQSVLETTKNDDFKRYLMTKHASGQQEFCCLRSRCINGSTLLHTACYYGHIPAMKELLSLRVDVNIRDYKGATPLHRAKDPDIMEILLEAGANVNAEDAESNTPLHVKCYGETNEPSEIECIQMLLTRTASLLIRNSRGLMPIHCCVMQGRIDVMQLLLHNDKSDSMASALSKESDRKPPSLVHLALANDFPECAQWLLSNGFQFKANEQDTMMRRILTEQIKLIKRADTVKFLLDNGADPGPKYPGGNKALHYAAGLSGPSDVLELLVAYKAEIDVINEEGCTPLFFATQSNNKFAACVLISQGANVRQKNSQGLTAFDYIVDFEEWIECGYFNEEIKARLKAYNLKHARDLIRAISKRVKPPVPMEICNLDYYIN
ncbi:Y381-like protein [Mya arenaria]|uniref:Y381-like protein n=1 Tax=Mya arenaria TaxID=6604 RepID=A0ABY7DYZ6_MYAAR|nr:Y381-like protein [Mya arenaria]